MSNIALVGIKSGMTSFFKENGEKVPLTLIKVDGNLLLKVKTTKSDGYNAFVVAGGGEQKEARVNKAQLASFKKMNASPRKFLKEFRVDFDLSPVSDASFNFGVSESIKGSLIDVTAVSKGKGFQGVMKRHGFAGMNASHGVSVTHRHGGSTGQREFPGKTFKNRKMAGRMGNETVTVQNMRIFDVNPALGLIAVVGSIPGHNGAAVFIKDAIKTRSNNQVFVVNGFDLLSKPSVVEGKVEAN